MKKSGLAITGIVVLTAWIFSLTKYGFGMFGFVVGIILTIIIVGIYTKFVDSMNDYKTKQYFADKYDKENKK